MDYLWHKVSEKEKEDIKKEAKEIMKNFASALKGVEKEKVDFNGVQRDRHSRKEVRASCEPDFRKLFFDNVPKKEGDWLKAEKGKWK